MINPEENAMNAKMIFAVLMVFAAVPASFAEHFGRASENSPFAGKPSVSAAVPGVRYGRASSHGDVTAEQKSEVKARLAASADVPGRA